MNVQFDLFEPNDDVSVFRKELLLIQDSNRRNHKAQFAKIGDAVKLLIEHKETNEREIARLHEELAKLRELLIERKK